MQLVISKNYYRRVSKLQLRHGNNHVIIMAVTADVINVIQDFFISFKVFQI